MCKGNDLRTIMMAAVKPFSLPEDELSAYLQELNNLPEYDLVLNLGEASLLFGQDKNASDLSDTEISYLEEFTQKVFSLPPESDDFWDNLKDNSRWKEVRHAASDLVAMLSR